MTIALHTLREARAVRAKDRPLFATRHGGDGKPLNIIAVEDLAFDGQTLYLMSAGARYTVRDREGFTLWAAEGHAKAAEVLNQHICLCPDCVSRYPKKRIRFSCRKCRRVWFADYWFGYAGPSFGICTFRVQEGRVIPAWWDAKCSCREQAQYRELKAVLNKAHKCDPRCWNAKSLDCRCSCGGANHGTGQPPEEMK